MSAFFQELFSTGLYKRSQGRITRQVTFAALSITVATGLLQMSRQMINQELAYRYGIPGLLLLVGLWAVFRLVNFPAFADFLIAVEAEMNKVSWPSRSELTRASIVVLITIFLLAALLATFDLIWQTLFKALGIL